MKKYDLDAFITADQETENDLAYLRNTVEIFNKRYDYPLIYIYGPRGAGKTYLLNSLYEAMRESGEDGRVLRYRIPDFVDEIIKTLQAGHNLQFRERLYSAEAILFDDVDKLEGKFATQEEFERVVNHFCEMENRLMIVTGTNSPETLPLTERLRNRLSWGKVIELKAPQTGMQL